MITDKDSLLAWKHRATAQGAGRTVLDLEADSLHRYREKLCLIQYADADGVVVIDPLEIEDMRPFALWLQETEVWMHGADYDMSLLQNAYGVLPKLILDTQIAARLLGFRQFGLAALVEHFFGISLSKKNQKADWGRRPITPDMLEYAQGDVAYMLDMADLMVADLRRLGRYDWFMESCLCSMERGRQRFENSHCDAWRIKGSGKLNRRGLAALRTLWRWRANEAEAWDRPAFMVCSNDDLLRWSQQLQEFRPVYPSPRGNSHRSARFHKAVDYFQLLDEEEYPKLPQPVRHHHPPHFERKLESWLARRDALAADLQLEPSIIAARSQVEAIAAGEEEGLAQLMRWQRELLCSASSQKKR